MTSESKEARQERLTEELKRRADRGVFRSPTGRSLVMHKARPWGRSHLPVVVFLHGFLRSPEYMLQWLDPLADVADVLLVDIPGHLRSTGLASPTLDAMADWIHEGLKVGLAGRRALLVGESLGGLIAMRIAGDAGPTPVRAVLAVDPPMTTSKQWTIGVTVEQMVRSIGPGDIANLAEAIFGIFGNRREERIYYPLLADLKAPVTLATGDNPLMPPRSGAVHPCLLDAVDRYVIDACYPGAVDIRTFTGGHHLLLETVVEPMRQLIVELLERQVSASPAVAS